MDARTPNKLMRMRVALQFVAGAGAGGGVLVAGAGGLMVVLNRIYTRTGDGGDTRLASGAPVRKSDARVEAYGAVDETNATLGLARLHADPALDALLERIQNDLFDLGADLATPETGEPLGYEPLRIVDSQVERLEREIDAMNAVLAPLTSFVLPAGSPASTYLHLARDGVPPRRAQADRAGRHARPDGGARRRPLPEPLVRTCCS
jgi:ATP:cob(I)alamin adenosyltransferase